MLIDPRPWDPPEWPDPEPEHCGNCGRWLAGVCEITGEPEAAESAACPIWITAEPA